jgi:hypothetical protein
MDNGLWLMESQERVEILVAEAVDRQRLMVQGDR